jgi:hypothetical protein
MKYKKIFILPALFILTHVLYISCCNCKKELFTFYKVNSVNNKISGSNNAVIDTGAITNVDSIKIKYDFFNECTATHTSKNPFSFLVNESFACKCEGCGRDGIKSKITTFSISSDSVYNGIVANTSLNNIFLVNVNDNSLNNLTIETFKNQINDGRGLLSTVNIFTKTKPSNTKGHIFKLTVSFEDGKVLTTSTNRIYWQ